METEKISFLFQPTTQTNTLNLAVAWAQQNKIFFQLEGRGLADGFIIQSLTWNNEIVSLKFKHASPNISFFVSTGLGEKAPECCLGIFEATFEKGVWSDFVFLGKEI